MWAFSKHSHPLPDPYRDTSLMRNSPPPPGPPYDPRYSRTVGSLGGGGVLMSEVPLYILPLGRAPRGVRFLMSEVPLWAQCPINLIRTSIHHEYDFP